MELGLEPTLFGSRGNVPNWKAILLRNGVTVSFCKLCLMFYKHTHTVLQLPIYIKIGFLNVWLVPRGKFHLFNCKILLKIPYIETPLVLFIIFFFLLALTLLFPMTKFSSRRDHTDFICTTASSVFKKGETEQIKLPSTRPGPGLEGLTGTQVSKLFHAKGFYDAFTFCTLVHTAPIMSQT